jgi:hypothetical protein
MGMCKERRDKKTDTIFIWKESRETKDVEHFRASPCNVHLRRNLKLLSAVKERTSLSIIHCSSSSFCSLQGVGQINSRPRFIIPFLASSWSFFFFFWFVRLLALRPLLAYCSSLG